MVNHVKDARRKAGARLCVCAGLLQLAMIGGTPRKGSPGPLPVLLVRMLGPWGAAPNPATFEKVDETFLALPRSSIYVRHKAKLDTAKHRSLAGENAIDAITIIARPARGGSPASACF